MKFCPKCGAENKADAKFCKKCGAVFNSVNHQTATPHTREEAKQTRQSHKKSNKWLIIILVVIILALLLVIGCILGKRGSSSSSSGAKSSESVAAKQSSELTSKQNAQPVYHAASEAETVDNREQQINIKDLTEDQLKGWALQTFKNTHSDSANDDLSVEYLGFDADKDAEVTVHDNDDSDKDTTYRVNSDGVLQEQDDGDWTTVSTSFSE